jgi:hypothetical protein
MNNPLRFCCSVLAVAVLSTVTLSARATDAAYSPLFEEQTYAGLLRLYTNAGEQQVDHSVPNEGVRVMDVMAQATQPATTNGSVTCNGTFTCDMSRTCNGVDTCNGGMTCNGGSTCDGSQTCQRQCFPATYNGAGTCVPNCPPPPPPTYDSSFTCQQYLTCGGGYTCDGYYTCDGSFTCDGSYTCDGAYTCDNGYTCGGGYTCDGWYTCHYTCDGTGCTYTVRGKTNNLAGVVVAFSGPAIPNIP